MTTPDQLPSDPQGLQDFLDRLQFVDEPVPADAAPPRLDPADAPMVKTSIKLPPELYLRIGEEAGRAGIGRSTLIRQLVEAGLADLQADGKTMVPLSELRRLLAGLAQRGTTA